MRNLGSHRYDLKIKELLNVILMNITRSTKKIKLLKIDTTKYEVNSLLLIHLTLLINMFVTFNNNNKLIEVHSYKKVHFKWQ